MLISYGFFISIKYERNFMKLIKLTVLSVFCMSVLVFSLVQKRAPQKPAFAAALPLAKNDSRSFNFPSFEEAFPPPDWWVELNKTTPDKYPIFKLSQNYPRTEPLKECPKTECKWKNFDFKTESQKYLTEVLKYAFQGNLETDWRVAENPSTNWFHAPWMHASSEKSLKGEKPDGREFVHGLTRERHLCNAELRGETRTPCPKPDRPIENWAVSLYNGRGAYFIGKIWEILLNKPDTNGFPSGGFPEGTVAVKLLFTQAGTENADFLENSIEWLVDNKRVFKTKKTAAECVSPLGISRSCLDVVRLLQVDVAVRDDHAKTGWVFGTFVYHKQAPPIFEYDFTGASARALTELEKENLRRWLKLDFVGLMYGNDPTAAINHDDEASFGKALTESVINKNTLSKQHLGCGGRLNGVVDNPHSSCLSCHAFAEMRKDFRMISEVEIDCRDTARERLFRNLDPRSPDAASRTFSPNSPEPVVSLDYSLQMREGIDRFCKNFPSRCGLMNKRNTKISATREGKEIVKPKSLKK